MIECVIFETLGYRTHQFAHCRFLYAELFLNHFGDLERNPGPETAF